MTFVVVKKLNGHIFSQEIDGMIDAGEKINNILIRTGANAVDYDDVFDTMFVEMTAGMAPPFSVSVGADGALHPLERKKKDKYKYNTNMKFKLKPQLDKEIDQDKAMNFVVPAERQDLLAGSAYLSQLAGGINAIANNKLTPAEIGLISKFLLAKIFLSRCH